MSCDNNLLHVNFLGNTKLYNNILMHIYEFGQCHVIRLTVRVGVTHYKSNALHNNITLVVTK